jgi:hypothetical protein
MPSLQTLFGSRAPTLNYMPGNDEVHQHFRLIFTAIVRQIQLTEAANNPTTALWAMLLSMPRMLLSLPYGKGQGNRTSTVSIVTRRISQFFDGSFELLRAEHSELLNKLAEASRNRVHANSPDSTLRSVVSTIKTSGDIGKAAKRLESTAKLANIDDDNTRAAVHALLGTGEQTAEAVVTIPAGEDCPTIAESDVNAALATFSNSSASGITGWHPSHIKAVAATPDGLKAVTFVVNSILSVRLPMDIKEGLLTSILVPLAK